MAAPPDSILTSWVTDNRDPANIRYHAGLIRNLGIDADKLPEIVQATEVVGKLTSTAAADLGLDVGTPVVAGTIDTSAAAIGSGAVGDGQPHLYIGTSSWLAAHVPWKRTNISSQIASVPCAMPDRYLMIALQSSAGSNLSFLRDHILFNDDELLQQEEQPDVYRILDTIAERVPAGSRGIMYTPWLFGERCPVDDGTLRAAFLNLSMQHSREEMIRAVLEGVAFNTRWMMGPVKKFLRDYDLNEITIVGGGGASDVWCQIFADVLDMRIRQLESPIQANVLGTAFIAGVGIGEMTFDDVPKRTRIRAVYEPIAEHRQTYDQAFANFIDVYKRLTPWYRRINKNQTGIPS
jgi:xylulokinase